MRNPSGKDGPPALSSSDVDSSNATLNSFFGASRKKSWMTVGPQRPTPRPAAVPVPRPLPQMPLSSQRPLPHKLPSPAASDEPSPNFLSSPTVAPSRLAPQIRPNTTQPASSTTPNSEPNEPPHAASVGQLESPSPLSSAASPVEVSNTRAPLQVQGVPTAEVPQAQGATVGGHASVSRLHPRSPSSSPKSHAQPLNKLPHPAGQGSNMSISSDSQSVLPYAQHLPGDGETTVHLESPQCQASAITQQVTRRSNLPPPSGGPWSYPPQKRQRTQPASSEFLKSCIPRIESHIQDSGGFGNLSVGLDRPRFQLLKDACNADDTFYVALHHIFCAWDHTSTRHEVTNIQGFPTANILTAAFYILGQLIRPNSGLAYQHLKWFAEFPDSLSHISKTCDWYRDSVQQAGIFLGKLSLGWQRLNQDCLDRNYPPLVDELIDRLGLLSPGLQKVVFTAMRRNLYIGENAFGLEIENLFSDDQEFHQRLASRINTGRPPQQTEIEERNQHLIDTYKRIIARHRQNSAAGVSSMSVASPIMPHQGLQSNAVPTSSSTYTHQAQSLVQSPNSVAWASSNGSSDGPTWQGSYQAQAAPQATGYNEMSRAVSHTQAMASGPQGLANTPTPILLQGVSTQSPTTQSPTTQQGFFSSPIIRNNASSPGVSGQVYGNNMGQHSHMPGHNMVNTPPMPGSHAQYGMYNMNHVLFNPQSVQQLHHFQQLQQQQQLQQTQQRQMQQLQQAHQHAQQAPRQTQPQTMHQNQLGRQNQQWDQQGSPQMRHGANQPAGHNQYLLQQQAMDRAANMRRASDNNRRFTANNGQMAHHVQSPPATQQVPVPLMEAHQSYKIADKLKRPLVPPMGYTHPMTNPDPDRTALHQAHVRSPILYPVDGLPAEDMPSLKYYQVVKEFALAPTKVAAKSAVTELEFSISDAAFDLKARDVKRTTDPLPFRYFRPGTLQYRLRCIQSRAETTECLLPAWVVTDTVWPHGIFLEFNGEQLEIRRKMHHAKDLPVDITKLVNSAHRGKNRLKISVPDTRNIAHGSYFVAVEVVEILEHDQIINMVCESQRVPANQTLNSIKKSLITDDEDDDFAMLVGDLSIDLADPFSAKIFDTPVRGAGCLHRECFDLEIFLVTRSTKPKRPKHTSMVDVWKCPLCAKDARPQSLRLDDFLASVRATLESQGKLDVKAIMVSADGSWKAKPEPVSTKRKASGTQYDDNDYDDEESALGGQPGMENGLKKATQQIEIIDLDDE